MKPRRDLHYKHIENTWNFSSAVISILLIVALISGFYFIALHHYFPFYLRYFYWGTKVLVALIVILGSLRSMFLPIFIVIGGLISLFTSYEYGINLITSADTLQLICVGIIGYIFALIRSH